MDRDRHVSRRSNNRWAGSNLQTPSPAEGRGDQPNTRRYAQGNYQLCYPLTFPSRHRRIRSPAAPARSSVSFHIPLRSLVDFHQPERHAAHFTYYPPAHPTVSSIRLRISITYGWYRLPACAFFLYYQNNVRLPRGSTIVTTLNSGNSPNRVFFEQIVVQIARTVPFKAGLQFSLSITPLAPALKAVSAISSPFQRVFDKRVARTLARIFFEWAPLLPVTGPFCRIPLLKRFLSA